ncbi:MAG: DUF1850 domain-containing protein [Spirochaetales bacterium]|nr:DUF1850 domain-containing protein [Spirochaetales bacterium]
MIPGLRIRVARMARFALAMAVTIVLGAPVSCVRPAERLELVITAQADGRGLLAVPAAAGDVLEFEWIHSVEHFPWFERFDVLADGSLFLRDMKVAGFGAGVPFERGTSVRVENGYIIYSGIDETYPSYRWINSTSAVASISLNGSIVARGSDLPHHEALELRILKRR